MTRMALPTPTLHTARLRLRPFGDADANDLFALHSNACVLRYWDAPPWSERVRAERFITACRQMAQEGTGARLAVDRISGGTFIGWCSLNRWNPDYRSASLGYCFDDAAWGHGYATEAACVLLRWAFDTLDLNRVQAETGYDGSIWPHHDGFMWLHLTAPVTVRCGPVSSGSEEKGLVRAGAKSSRHTATDDQGGATSRRPSGPNSSRPSQAETDTRNVASARVLEKLGFVREGTLREDCIVNGEVSDSWVYGLIRREWRPSSEPVPAR
jgi:RimJ/RimL family protein N-acetyltransferase